MEMQVPDKGQHGAVLPVYLFDSLCKISWERAIGRYAWYWSTSQVHHHLIDGLQILTDVISIRRSTLGLRLATLFGYTTVSRIVVMSITV